MTPNEELKALQNETCANVKAILENLLNVGITASMQFTIPGFPTHAAHITTMPPTMVLGTLEMAKIITTQGLQTHHSLNCTVQAMEQNPDLVKRMTDVQKRAEEQRGDEDV